MHRSVSLMFRGLFALALLVPVSAVAVSPASADHSLNPTTTCNNSLGNGGGQGIICEVTIVNSITPTGGSATIKVHECHGSAGAPLSGVCSTTTRILTQPVTKVYQCNGSVNGGGSTLRCSVILMNNFYGASPGSSAVSVNECIGSGAGGIIGNGITGNTIHCDPIQNTTSAAITQCNGSANGLTLVHLNCTATGTMASAHRVTINQCNGSANGGGALVECSATMRSQAYNGTPPPTTATTSGGSSNDSTPLFPLLIIVALGGMGLVMFVVQKRSIRS
jgi:hypothetical protein